MRQCAIVEPEAIGGHRVVAKESVARELLDGRARHWRWVLVPLEEELEGDFASAGAADHRVLVWKGTSYILQNSITAGSLDPQARHAPFSRRRRRLHY